MFLEPSHHVYFTATIWSASFPEKNAFSCTTAWCIATCGLWEPTFATWTLPLASQLDHALHFAGSTTWRYAFVILFSWSARINAGLKCRALWMKWTDYCDDSFFSRVLEIAVSRGQAMTRAGRGVTPFLMFSLILYVTPVLYARKAVNCGDVLFTRRTSLTCPWPLLWSRAWLLRCRELTF